jgi:TATA-box binding protein (TBP) (component of TFIID and TFIIIB)
MSKELPPNLRVSTMTATSKINTDINIGIVYSHLELDDNIKFIEYSDKPSRGFHHKLMSEKKKSKKKVFYNQITIIVLIENDINNIKLFNNGSISMTGVKSQENGKKAINILFNKLQKTKNDENVFVFSNPEAEITKFDIVLINSDYDVGYEIKRSELHQILVTQYKIFSSFEPCIYPGVNSKFLWNSAYKDEQYTGKCYCHGACNGKGSGNGEGDCKKVTVSVFQSGSVIITGAKTTEQINDAYTFINKVFLKHKPQIKKINPTFLDNDLFGSKIIKPKKTIWIKKESIIYS